MKTYVIFVVLLALAFLLYPYSDPQHSGKKKEFSPRDGEVFVNSQGLNLYTKKWEAKSAPRGAVFLVHGLLEHSGRYQEVIESLNKEGYNVYTIDLQGHGQSEGDPGYVEEYKHWVEETIQWIEYQLEKLDKSLPRFILGHSNGGLVTTRVVLERPQLLNGMILSAPLLYFGPEVADPTTVAAITLFSDYLPKLPLIPIDNTRLSKVPDVVEKILADELHWKGKVPARTLYHLFKETSALLDKFTQINIPFLCMHGTGDTVTNPEGSRLLYEKANSQDKTFKKYEGYYHELFNEEGKEVVIKDLIDWLNNHTKSSQ